MIKKILYEPLFHFLVVGMAVYMLYMHNAQSNKMVSVSTNTNTVSKIVVSKYELKKEEKIFDKYFDKNLINDLSALLEKKIYEDKALLQEAYALKLYENDKSIDNILLPKVKYVLLNQQKMKNIDEKDIYKYYKEHIKDYSKRKNITFLHIHFNQQKDQKTFTVLKDLLKNAGELKNVQKDEHKSFSELKKIYGNYFVTILRNMDKGVWRGEIPTKDGYEFVYILGYETGEVYPFEDVQDRVYEDFKADFRKKNHQRVMQLLENKYG